MHFIPVWHKVLNSANTLVDVLFALVLWYVLFVICRAKLTRTYLGNNLVSTVIKTHYAEYIFCTINICPALINVK